MWTVNAMLNAHGRTKDWPLNIVIHVCGMDGLVVGRKNSLYCLVIVTWSDVKLAVVNKIKKIQYFWGRTAHCL